MKKLYYATFEKGFDLIVEKYIKKRDRNSRIKTLYNDSVIFFADEHFSFVNTLFVSAYVVLDNTNKEGAGAMNAGMKHLLERKDFRISLPKNVRRLKLTYVYSKEKMVIDAKLKNAFETMLSRVTKRHFCYFDADMEFSLIVKDDGECMFAKNITINSEALKMSNFSNITFQTAFAMNFLSNPNEKEVSLDPFAGNGMISYVRALCFKKANIIANEENSDKIPEIKRKAKSLKDKVFSVMNYDFLMNNFPIKFIDKIVTVLPESKLKQSSFFEKANMLKVKTIVVLVNKFNEIRTITNGLFRVLEEYDTCKGKIFKLELCKAQ